MQSNNNFGTPPKGFYQPMYTPFAPNGQPIYRPLAGRGGTMGPGGLQGQDQYNLNLQTQVAEMYNKQLQEDMDRGRERGDQVYGQGVLGRLDSSRPQETQGLIDTYKSLSEQGLNAPAYQGMRERRMGEINSSEQSYLSNINRNIANSGTRGGAANKLQMQASRNANIDRQKAATDLNLADTQYKDQARQQYANTFNNARSDEMARNVYNQGQAAKELQGRQAYEFGYGSLGAAQRGAAQKYIAGQQQVQQAQAQAMSGGGGGK